MGGSVFGRAKNAQGLALILFDVIRHLPQIFAPGQHASTNRLRKKVCELFAHTGLQQANDARAKRPGKGHVCLTGWNADQQMHVIAIDRMLLDLDGKTASRVSEQYINFARDIAKSKGPLCPR